MAKSILLIISGGIAAYKALELIRRLRDRGHDVRVVMSAAASEFITPLSVAALSGHTVHSDLFSLTEEAAMGHIELSRAADLIIVAPASADVMAKAAHGLANDLAATLLLATDTKVLYAPSMNVRMWLHPATQRNIALLRQDGAVFVGPGDGAMACGEFGPGRMAEVPEILAAAAGMLEQNCKLPLPSAASGVLAGRHVVITSGPTHEPIDPVRYIANRSSGRQGHALAAAALAAGARVTLISGPVALPPPAGVHVVDIETARDMLAATSIALPADIFIAAAAVADWHVAHIGAHKVKKTGDDPPHLKLVENPDILASIANMREGRPKLVIGFAAETDQIIPHGLTKLQRKGCDMIIANDVSAASGVMGGTSNLVHVISAAGVDSWPKLDKSEVARRLMALFATRLQDAS